MCVRQGILVFGHKAYPAGQRAEIAVPQRLAQNGI
jgi:hypothetical protein